MSPFQFVVLLSLFIFPLFPSQDTVWVRYVVIALCLVLLPVFVRAIKEAWEVRDRRVLFFLLFLVASALSTLFSVDKLASLVQLAIFFAAFVVFVSASFIFSDLASKERVAIVLLAVTSILSVISLYHTLVLHYVSRLGRGVSFAWVYFGHNHLSAILIFAIPLCFYFIQKYWEYRIYRTLFILNFVFLILSLLFTFARASIMSLVAACLFAVVAFGWKQKVFLIALWASVVVLTLGAAVTRFGADYLGAVSKNELSHTERLAYVSKAIENAYSQPLYGRGLNTYRAEGVLQSLQSIYAHNFFFQMLSDAGIPGFMTSVALIISVLWYSLRRSLEKQGKEGFFLAVIWVGLFASTLNTFFDFDWQLPTVLFIFWLLAGLF